ncbi:MAG: hypothetical protein ABR936_11960 [Bacteroidota bacterium]|jgi:hypothetical protein
MKTLEKYWLWILGAIVVYFIFLKNNVAAALTPPTTTTPTNPVSDLINAGTGLINSLVAPTSPPIGPTDGVPVKPSQTVTPTDASGLSEPKTPTVSIVDNPVLDNMPIVTHPDASPIIANPDTTNQTTQSNNTSLINDILTALNNINSTLFALGFADMNSGNLANAIAGLTNLNTQQIKDYVVNYYQTTGVSILPIPASIADLSNSILKQIIVKMPWVAQQTYQLGYITGRVTTLRAQGNADDAIRKSVVNEYFAF